MRIGGTLVAIAACLAVVPARAGTAPKPPNNLSEEMKPAFKAFAGKCSQCHDAARAYGARYKSEKEWQTLVARMARKGGAVISKADQKRIVAYLTWYSSQK